MAGLLKLSPQILIPGAADPIWVELVQMMVEQRMTETTAVSWAAGGVKWGEVGGRG